MKNEPTPPPIDGAALATTTAPDAQNPRSSGLSRACAPSRSTATTRTAAQRRGMQTMQIELDSSDRMLLDALMKLKAARSER